jgi:hypothetical protein
MFLTTSVSCSTYGVLNKKYPGLVFSDIKSDYSLNDLNNYGCGKIDISVLKYILENGTWITEKIAHDYYSTTGCTINGIISINNKSKKFVFDYGGIFYFNDGKMLGCGENCCRENYPHCSYDKKNLKGF